MNNRSAPVRKLDRAIELFNQGSVEKATTIAKRLELTYPRCFASANLLAGCLLTLQEFSKAEAAYKKALILNPKDYVGSFNRGVCLQDLGRFEEAIECYENALAVNSDFHDALFNKAQVLGFLGRADDALQAFTAVFQRDGSSGHVAHAYANALIRCRQFEEAREVLDRFPTSANEYRSIGCLYALGREKESLDRLTEFAHRDKLKGSIRIPLASISAFISDQLDCENPYPFCANPFDFIWKHNICDEVRSLGIETSGFFETLIADSKELKSAVLTHTATVGNITETTLFEHDRPSIGILKEIIVKSITEYRRNYAHFDSQPLIKNWPTKWELKAWFVSLGVGGHQRMHTHNSAWISGCIYLQVIDNPEDREGAIKWCLSNGWYERGAEKTEHAYHQPLAGDLVLFPSSLPHGTVPVKANAERCCIAFDLEPVS
jgi:thioredoxin-like negative regulator of GroEL